MPQGFNLCPLACLVPLFPQGCSFLRGARFNLVHDRMLLLTAVVVRSNFGKGLALRVHSSRDRMLSTSSSGHSILGSTSSSGVTTGEYLLPQPVADDHVAVAGAAAGRGGCRGSWGEGTAQQQGSYVEPQQVTSRGDSLDSTRDGAGSPLRRLTLGDGSASTVGRPSQPPSLAASQAGSFAAAVD